MTPQRSSGTASASGKSSDNLISELGIWAYFLSVVIAL